MSRVCIMPAGGAGTRMGNAYPNYPKQLLPCSKGRIIDYALAFSDEAGCWPHVIVPRGDRVISTYVARKHERASFSYARDNLLDSVGSLWTIFRDSLILYVMPDTILGDESHAEELLELANKNGVALALFWTGQTIGRYGMCYAFDGRSGGIVTGIKDKPREWKGPQLAWGAVAWKGDLWGCIHSGTGNNFSDVLNEYLREHISIPYIMLDKYMDIGTPKDYNRAKEIGW